MEKELKKTVLVVIILSVLVVMLTLSMAANMMLLYMWVIPSESISTIRTVTSAALTALVFMLIFDLLRSALLRRLSVHVNENLGQQILLGLFKDRAEMKKGESSVAMEDLAKVRGFLHSPIATAFLDALIAPLELAIVFAVSPAMGALALVGMLVIVATKFFGRNPIRTLLRSANQRFSVANGFAQECLHNAQTVQAMGMRPQLAGRWRALQDAMIVDQSRASEKAGIHSALIKSQTWILQVLLMGVGTYLIIAGKIDPGLMLVAVIIAGRVIQPTQVVVDGWEQYQNARDAFDRLRAFWKRLQDESQAPKLELPRPQGLLKAESLIYGVAGKVILRGISFDLEPGQTLGIIGPSGAGKTTLARLITGAMRPANGVLRLDGADMHQWDQDKLGVHIGYLPQEVELFAGTIAGNISRFEAVDSTRVHQAAERAQIHEAVMALPRGYETVLEERGQNLPGGLRQRIGMARALFGDPRLIILDEPDASLDQKGLEALEQTLRTIREEKISLVLVTHRQKLLILTDKLLMLKDGQVGLYGATQEVLQKLMLPPPKAPAQVG
jgi:PrtD family type I secretion system ABC transporter